MRPAALIGLLLCVCSFAEAPVSPACACDPANPEVMKQRQCSLCSEAEKHSPDVGAFILKDINPRKPHRWLALPRNHGEGLHPMSALTKSDKQELWKTAIAKAQELWGNEWGLAINAEGFRTQCHTHIHIGKLIKGLAPGKYVDVKNIADIPAPGATGIWVEPKGNLLRVHLGELVTETVLIP